MDHFEFFTGMFRCINKLYHDFTSVKAIFHSRYRVYLQIDGFACTESRKHLLKSLVRRKMRTDEWKLSLLVEVG